MHGAIPGLMVLGLIRKQTEQDTRSRPLSSSPPRPLCHIPPPGSWPTGVLVLSSIDGEQQYGRISQINAFLLKLLVRENYLYSVNHVF